MRAQNIFFESGGAVDEAATAGSPAAISPRLIREHLRRRAPLKRPPSALSAYLSGVVTTSCPVTRPLRLKLNPGLAAQLWIPWSPKCWNAPRNPNGRSWPKRNSSDWQNDFELLPLRQVLRGVWNSRSRECLVFGWVIPCAVAAVDRISRTLCRWLT